ncbi:endonuclease domain-containing protein [Hymenobacter artigasi]|uniref:Very-short-patch-repair endonuclease n=1 Tax=Hymenobacter artigasi TaxID=2719616 RepID=A0ABX1HJT0_9BACT|nr:endonuclease domain-containing protein [Hymenobacter artigasi]NKI89211.1 very-short-patch-repair endonuclease [Hymenobacter artigasi]
MDSGGNEKPAYFHAFMTDAETWRNSLKDYSRANRQKATEAENVLWQLVRGNKLGPRFRRQHAIERYIVDFICLPAWLIIEVDGEYHFEVEQAEYDGGRTYDLHELGFHIMRFTNQEVLQHPDYVLKQISTHLLKHSPNPQGCRQAPPLPKERGPGGEVTQ